MIRKEADFNKIEDFMRDKDVHLFHPIYSHDVYHYGISDCVEKLSIQGKTVEDSIELIHLLKDYLINKNITFKAGTQSRFDLRELKVNSEKEKSQMKEQSYKAMTIYCPIDINILDLAKDISDLLINYNGHEGVSPPSSYTHYNGAIYYRRDIDENGNYIRPN